MQPQQPSPETREQLIDELLAAMEARKELSRADEQYLAEAFVDRLEQEVDRRIDAKLAQRHPRNQAGPGLIIPLLVFAIPLSAIGGTAAGFFGILVVWVALALIVYFASQ